MTNLREAARMALDALEGSWNVKRTGVQIPDAIEALRAALAQPEPEPVATIGNWGEVMWAKNVFPQLGDKMYAAPPQREWVGLTEDEAAELTYASIQEIEDALRKKNT